MYQAGSDLEGKLSQLKKGCYIRIDRIKTQLTTRRKEALCCVIQNGEWHLLVDYNKCQLYQPTSPMCTRTLDVKQVEVKGVKRKLALTQNGQVVRFYKRGRVENNLKVGDLL